MDVFKVSSTLTETVSGKGVPSYAQGERYSLRTKITGVDDDLFSFKGSIVYYYL